MQIQSSKKLLLLTTGCTCIKAKSCAAKSPNSGDVVIEDVLCFSGLTF